MPRTWTDSVIHLMMILRRMCLSWSLYIQGVPYGIYTLQLIINYYYAMYQPQHTTTIAFMQNHEIEIADDVLKALWIFCLYSGIRKDYTKKFVHSLIYRYNMYILTVNIGIGCNFALKNFYLCNNNSTPKNLFFRKRLIKGRPQNGPFSSPRSSAC